jgi:hypothetical protein
MSAAPTLGTNAADSSQQWAALDSRNERLVEASHPLLRAPDEGRADGDRQSGAAA